jgi:BlaI family penicillinase repressor
VKLSDAEWTVMSVVWRDAPVSARDVLEAVSHETGWAYTTVKTLLARLVEKGVLRTRKRANTNLFEPLISREQARKSALRSLVERAFDGTFGSLVQHMIATERLSDSDRRRLAAMLAESDREKGRLR